MEKERIDWLNIVLVKFKELNPNIKEFYKQKRKEYRKTYRDKNTKALTPYVRKKKIKFTKEYRSLYFKNYHKKRKEKLNERNEIK